MPTSFYATHSVYSDPGPFREILIRGGTEPKAIARWINSVLQHPRGPESVRRGFAPQQVRDLECRSVVDLLSVATARDLFGVEPMQPKVGAVCRDFALLAVSSFRERGVLARLRVGFADYLAPGCWEDHWLCEWRDSGCWRRLDVEFAAVEAMPFDATDVPRQRFVTAEEAWFRIKDEPDIASRFGVSSLGLTGEWFVAGSLFREIAALRKLELKPWDYWGLSKDLSRATTAWSPQARTELDQLAFLLKAADVGGESEPAALTNLPLPSQVISIPHGEPISVVLRENG